jgi:hypothetical protein
MVAPLLAIREASGSIPAGEKRLWAHVHRTSVRTIERAIEEAMRPTPEPRAFRPSRPLLVRIAMHAGNVAEAVTELRGEGFELPSYPTIMRSLAEEDAGLRLALAKGMKAFEAYLTVGRFEPDHRNELWYIDAMHVPVYARDRHGNVITDLWLLSVYEAYSRTCLARLVTIGAPTATDAVHVFLAAVMGRGFTRDELRAFLSEEVVAGVRPTPGIDPERPFLVGGAPEGLLTDNGSIFTADEFRTAVRPFVTGAHKFGRPYIAVDKAKQERWHWTLVQKRLSALPGYVEGPRPREGEEDVRPYAMPPDASLPRAEAVVAAIDAAIDDLNRHHIVSTTGQTGYARWFADPTPLRPVAPINLWHDMPLVGTYTVQGSGVHVDRVYRQSTTLARLISTEVEVRGFPGQPGRFFVGDGAFLDEVHPHAERTEDERAADGVSNAVRSRRVRSVLRQAGDQLQEDGLPEEQLPAAVRARQATRRGGNRRGVKRERLADPAAAAAVGWDAKRLGEVVA